VENYIVREGNENELWTSERAMIPKKEIIEPGRMDEFFGICCRRVKIDEAGKFESLVVVDHGNGAAIFAVAPHRSLTVQARGTSDPEFGNGRAFVAVMFEVDVRL